MRLSDLFKFSFDNLRRRKGRTILTVIGVVVGVCAIVVMVSLGIAVNRATDEMLQSWGDLTKITINSYGAQQGTPDLDDTMVEQFKGLEHVVAATPMYSPEAGWGQVLAGRNSRYMTEWTNLYAIDPTAIEPMGYELVTGSYLTGQSLGKDKIAVMVDVQTIFNFVDTRLSWRNPNYQNWPEYDTDEAMYSGKPSNLPQYDENGVLLNPENFFLDIMNTPLTYRMEIGWDDNSGEYKYKEYEFVVVGMINSGDSYELSQSFIISIEDAKKLENDYKRATGSTGSSMGGMVYYGGGGSGDTVQVGGYNTVYVKVDNVANMPAVEKQIREIGYQIYSMSSTREQMQGQVAQTQMMLGGLAAVSLLVAALNIMNTMTMAIYERTKEIGVMKVLGCKLPNIRQMFLIESGAIGLVGGIAGVVLSVLLSLVLNYLPQMMAMLGVEGTVDIASMFGLQGLTEMMPDMQLSVIPLWLVILALAFATVVGLLSGIAPANRAVKISSLEAIRHE